MSERLPRYARVRANLIERLSAGEWAPGSALPSEMALAAEFGVSHGTARKAIDSLVTDGVLFRAQGKGTFVSEQTPELANFRFLRIVDGNGHRAIPELLKWSSKVEKADPATAEALHLGVGNKVHRIERTRAIDGTPAILEQIRIPHAIMPGLGEPGIMPNALYPWYQSAHAVTVLRTDDQLSAVAANPETAKALSIAESTPLLRSVRVAYDLKDRAVEYRISHFLTEAHSFSISLG
ncbi:MAG: GntR family transcriptional regulator [Pseudomonadota bacterium]